MGKRPKKLNASQELDKKIKSLKIGKEQDFEPRRHDKSERVFRDIKRTPVPDHIKKKYSRGDGMRADSHMYKSLKKKQMLNKEEDLKFAEEEAARAEILLTDVPGFIEPDEGEQTCDISQVQIRKHVDITSSSKMFELQLPFGPYRIDYTRNGRYLLLAGKKGHVAAMDWVTKRLMCEINVMEQVFDVKWLHVETMFAVAQKEWAYIYDNKGVELHCLKRVARPLFLEFLPYHFLLSVSNDEGYLTWLDISTGQHVTSFNTYRGRPAAMTMNPYNALICLGHQSGVVTMWSPNNTKPLATLLCQSGKIQGITVDPAGVYMATSSVKRDIKIWDVRNLTDKPLQTLHLSGGSPSDISFSQKGLLAASVHSTVEVFREPHLTSADCYLRHKARSPIFNLEFSPYEDILGLGTSTGFFSMLVPGAGEANFDALECNPMASKTQRQEMEVKALLEKIQPEMIMLDPTVLGTVDVPTLQEKHEAKEQILLGTRPTIDFEPRKKTKHKKLNKAAIIRKVLGKRNEEYYKKITAVKQKLMQKEGLIDEKPDLEKNALDRFKPKRRVAGKS